MSRLAPFVPAFARKWLSDGTFTAEHPVVHNGLGVVMAADLVGFTALTDRFAQRSAEGGAEAVQEAINACFGALNEEIGRYGGEVLAFAGDATMALWWCDEDSLGDTVTIAGACGLAIQERLDGVEAAPDFPVRLRVAISSGPVWAAIVGGEGGDWHPLAGGAPFVAVAEAEKAAEPGEVILDAASVSVAGRGLRCEARDGGCAKLVEVLAPIDRSSLGASRPDPLKAAVVGGEGISTRPALEDTIDLSPLLSAPVVQRLQSDRTQWLAEFRSATVLFVGLDDVLVEDEELLSRLQDAVVALQRQVRAFGGQLNQLIVMDTGQLTGLVVWGLSASTFENDPERAVRTALGLSATLHQLGFRADLGVARGRVFAGLRGGAHRLEYAVIGDPVNLSFRLMRRSERGVLCDRAVRDGARRVRFDEGRALRLKGKPQPVDAFRPSGLHEGSGDALAPMVGREDELRELTSILGAVAKDSTSRILVVEGEAGIGKSHLIEVLAGHARLTGVPTIRGAAEAIESATAYRAWRAVFRDALGIDARQDPMDRQRHVLDMLRSVPGGTERASLLSEVLGVRFDVHPSVSNMTGQARADATRELLVELFLGSGTDSPKLLVLEDVHWMDSASWALAEHLQERASGLCTVLVSRPLSEHPVPESGQRMLSSAALHLSLEPLGRNHAIDLACRKLGVEDLPEAVQSVLLEKAGGHPFFTLELTLALRDGEVLRVEDSRCIVDEERLRDSVHVPDTVQGVVTSRIDRLASDQQLTLKVASVLGRTFRTEVLTEVHPIEADRPLIGDHLEAMAESDLVMRVDGGFAFKHAITRDTAYGMLPFAQRRTLHRSAAEWHELNHSDDPSFFPLLADHWSYAGATSKAMDFLERAGEHAYGSAAYLETIRFFRSLLKLADELEAAPADAPLHDSRSEVLEPLSRARWLRQLGEAEYSLGRLADGEKHLAASANLLGRRVPSTKLGVAAELAGMSAWRLARWLLPEALKSNRKFGADAVRELAKALNVLGRVYHLKADPPRTIYTILRRYNMLDPVEPIPEHMIALSGWAYLMSMLGLHRARHEAIRRMKAIAAGFDEPVMYADSLFPVTVMRLGRGEWEECREECRLALSVFEEYGERAGEHAIVAVIANMEQLLGNLDVAIEWSSRLRESAGAGRDSLTECWAWGGIGIVHLRRGDLDLARDAATEALQLARDTGEEISILSSLGTLAASHLRVGDFDGVASYMSEALPMVHAQPRLPSAHHHIHGYATMAEATLTLWKRSLRAGAADAPQRAKDATVAIGNLTRYAKIFPIGEPAAGIWTGVKESMRGRRRPALHALQRAIDAAERLSMRYEGAVAHREWAKLLEPEDLDRTRHLEEARQTFEEMSARFDRDRVDELMGGASG